VLGLNSGTYFDGSPIFPGTTEYGGRNCGQQYPGLNALFKAK
jgi:hypothetical protein